MSEPLPLDEQVDIALRLAALSVRPWWAEAIGRLLDTVKHHEERAERAEARVAQLEAELVALQKDHENELEEKVFKIHDELVREERRTPEHASCRETEQRLREANRRLQTEGPALERDELILQLRQEIERLHAIVAGLTNTLAEQS